MDVNDEGIGRGPAFGREDSAAGAGISRVGRKSVDVSVGTATSSPARKRRASAARLRGVPR